MSRPFPTMLTCVPIMLFFYAIFLIIYAPKGTNYASNLSNYSYIYVVDFEASWFFTYSMRRSWALWPTTPSHPVERLDSTHTHMLALPPPPTLHFCRELAHGSHYRLHLEAAASDPDPSIHLETRTKECNVCTSLWVAS